MLLNCRHCGAPVRHAALESERFCCAGCAFVHRLITTEGLDRYYRLKDPVTAPADGAVFQPRNYEWIERAPARAGDGSPCELNFSIQGLSCAACIWLIEKLYAQQPGAGTILINAQLGTMTLTGVSSAFDPVSWARRLQTFGYLLGPADASGERSPGRTLGPRIGLCALCALNVMLFALPTYFGMRPAEDYAQLFGWLSFVFATLSVLCGGSYFFARAAAALRAGAMHIDLPIAVGIAGAYLGSVLGWLLGRPGLTYFDFVATFTLLMLVGRWAQTSAVENNRRRLLRRQPLPPRLTLADGGEVARDAIQPNQKLLIRPGETVPVECELHSVLAAFSLASICGEAAPRILRAGQAVPAGAENAGQNPVALLTRETWAASKLQPLLAPAPAAPVRHPALERIVRLYVAAILLGSGATLLAWGGLRRDWPRGCSSGLAVLVVACPCAIGLALPLTDELAALALRRRGVYVRESDLWARLARVKKILFDKTGTLTLEAPLLLNPEALKSLDAEAQEMLGALVEDGRHPVAQALREHLLVSGATAPRSQSVIETIGSGVSAGSWSLGKAGWKDRGPADGATVLACSGNAVAQFRFADAIRPGALQAVRRLRAAGYEVGILSGDREDKVQAIAFALGLDAAAAIGGLNAEEKAAWVCGHAAGEALMIGDGANDSLAFNAALCRGTPVIHRGVLAPKADFYWLRQGIDGVCDLVDTARRRTRCERCLVGFSLAYNAAAIAMAAIGRVGPWTAAVLMPASSLVSIALVTFLMRNPRLDHGPKVVLGPLTRRIDVAA